VLRTVQSLRAKVTSNRFEKPFIDTQDKSLSVTKTMEVKVICEKESKLASLAVKTENRREVMMKKNS